MEAMLSHESSEGQSLNNSVTIILTDLNSGKPVPFEQGMSLKPSSYVYAISTQHPCFVSYYSRIHISQPKKLDSLYDIHTYFEDKNDRLNYLVAGEPVQLKVQLNVNSAAPYLKLIIPIPASCSYYTDLNSALYYQEKYSDHVEIYIPQLEAGNYEFWVYLIPKFSGTYTLNPTQIYQIYFPTFSGNNQCSKVIVQTSVE
jgi:hypothetical protein